MLNRRPVVAGAALRARESPFPAQVHWKNAVTIRDTPDVVPGPSASELVVVEMPPSMVAQSKEEMIQMGHMSRVVIDEAITESGAVLLRRVPICEAEMCEAFVEGLHYDVVPYEPFGGPRKKLGKLDMATTMPGSSTLTLHNEMVYNPRPAKKIILICLKPAEIGGESLIGSGAAIYKALPSHIMRRFEERGGIKYSRIYYSPDKEPADKNPFMMSWAARTARDTKEGAEAFFRDLGCHVDWKDDESMHVWNIEPAVVPDPVTGQPLWFNLTHLPYPMVSYANGEAIEEEVMAAIYAARSSATRALKMDAGDVLVLDNYRYLHGRLPYEGTDRTLVTVLTSN